MGPLPSGWTVSSRRPPSDVPATPACSVPAGGPSATGAAAMILSRLPADVVHAPRPVDPQVGGIDLRRVHRLADLRHGFAQAGRELVDEQPGADLDQPVAQGDERVVRFDRHHCLGVHVAGVEAFGHLHHTDTCHPIAGEQRPLDRCGAAPPRQQREVQVDHGEAREHVRLDQAPERDDDAEVGQRVQLQQCVHLVDDRDAELPGGPLHRARHELVAPPAALVGVRDGCDHLETGVGQRSQRRHGDVGRAEEGQPARPAGEPHHDRRRRRLSLLPSANLRYCFSAALRWSGSIRSNIKMPCRWSVSCWNIRPISSSPSIWISSPSTL
jgi:hypothetical protein